MMNKNETLSSTDAAAAFKCVILQDELQRSAAIAALDLSRDSACIDLDKGLLLLQHLEKSAFHNQPFLAEEGDKKSLAGLVRPTANVLGTVLKFMTGRMPPAEELMRILPIASSIGQSSAASLYSALPEQRPWLLDQALGVLQAAQRWSVGVGLHPLQSLRGASSRTMEQYFGVKGINVRLLARAIWGSHPPFVLPEVDKAVVGFFALMQGDLATGLSRLLGIPRVMITQNTVQLSLLHNSAMRNQITRLLLKRLPQPTAAAVVKAVQQLAGIDAASSTSLTAADTKALQTVPIESFQNMLGLIDPVSKVSKAMTGGSWEGRRALAVLSVVKFAASRLAPGINTSVIPLQRALPSSTGSGGMQISIGLDDLLGADIATTEAASAGLDAAQSALGSLGMITDFLSDDSSNEIFRKRLSPQVLLTTLGGILLRGKPSELLTTIPVFVQGLVKNEPKLVAAIGIIQHFVALMQARLAALEQLNNAAASSAEGSINRSALSGQGTEQHGAVAARDSAGGQALAVSRAAATELAKRQQHIMQLLESVIPIEHHGALVIIDALMSLARKDTSGIRKLALQFGGYNKERLETIIVTITGLVDQLNKAGVDVLAPSAARATTAATAAVASETKLARQTIQGAQGDANTALAARFKALPLVNGRLSDQAIDLLYDAFDTDGGGISFDEFVAFTNNAAIPLSNERAKRIFAALDTGGAGGNDDVLNRAEFKAGINILLGEITHAALAAIGLSWEALTHGIVVLAILLFIVLAFILLGVRAMSTGGSFGAMINSLMPLGGAGALAVSTDPSTIAKQLGEKATALKERIAEAIHSLQPKE
jgi:hypothetical protein